jgi:opacity protein-like surface antigen
MEIRMSLAHLLCRSDRSCNFQAQPIASVSDWRRLQRLAVLATAALIASTASAAEEARFQLTPFAGYAVSSDFESDQDVERNVKDTSGWGLILNFEEQPSRYYELIYSTFSPEVEGDPALDMDIHYLQIGGTVAYPEATRVIPYLGLTAGAARFSPDVNGLDSATRVAFSIGAGVRVPITEHIGIRAEWRSYITLLSSDSDVFCKSAEGSATCLLRSESDTFLQHTAQLGVVIGF